MGVEVLTSSENQIDFEVNEMTRPLPISLGTRGEAAGGAHHQRVAIARCRAILVGPGRRGGVFWNKGTAPPFRDMLTKRKQIVGPPFMFWIR